MLCFLSSRDDVSGSCYCDASSTMECLNSTSKSLVRWFVDTHHEIIVGISSPLHGLVVGPLSRSKLTLAVCDVCQVTLLKDSSALYDSGTVNHVSGMYDEKGFLSAQSDFQMRNLYSPF